MVDEIQMIRDLAWVQRNGWRVKIDDIGFDVPSMRLELNGIDVGAEPFASLRECAVFIAGYNAARRTGQGGGE